VTIRFPGLTPSATLSAGHLCPLKRGNEGAQHRHPVSSTVRAFGMVTTPTKFSDFVHLPGHSSGDLMHPLQLFNSPRETLPRSLLAGTALKFPNDYFDAPTKVDR
jgi:hypothetical protein